MIEIKHTYQNPVIIKTTLMKLRILLGNVIPDDELMKLTGLDDKGFAQKIKSIYSSKKNKRIDLIGEKENNDLEKKIFLQIIDFSWRSHLQYLEQLRQVIGLRSYGQKTRYQNLKRVPFVFLKICY